MKTKEQKKGNIDTMANQLPDSTITIFTTFARKGEKGLSVAQMQALKRTLRAAQGEYVVAKKTLIEKALEQIKYDGIDVYGMEGSMGLALGHGDAYATAKQLYAFAKENKALQLFGAWTDGHFVSRDEFMAMATLPGRNELIASLLGMLKYPLSSLAIVLNQVAQKKTA
jgi:large subunit ribosomal protein L10